MRSSDNTNVGHPLVSVITTIGLDHQDLLGSTLEEITAQKAGIIKAGQQVVVGPVTRECMDVIRSTASEQRRNSAGVWGKISH